MGVGWALGLRWVHVGWAFSVDGLESDVCWAGILGDGLVLSAWVSGGCWVGAEVIMWSIFRDYSPHNGICNFCSYIGQVSNDKYQLLVCL